MANKYIISTDNCADFYKSEMDRLGIYYVPLKRILGDKEFAELYDSPEEFATLYEDLKKGALPTTSQINPDEFTAHFKKILAKEPAGDIIHVSLSSALSGSHSSAVIAANELNPTLKGRKIYAYDSLSCSGGQNIQVEKFVEMRASTDAETAIKTVQDLSDNQQIFFMVDSLNHLKRGGRISATKAFIGAILGIKPILTINKHGKLAVVDKTKTNKAVDFFLAAIAKHSNPGEDFNGKTILVLFTVKTEVYKSMYEAVKAKYPSARVKEAQVGPIIGSHVGGGTMGVFFPGKPRLDV